MKKLSLGMLFLCLLTSRLQRADEPTTTTCPITPKHVNAPEESTSCTDRLDEAYKFALGNTYKKRKANEKRTYNQCPLCKQFGDCDEIYHRQYEPTLSSKVTDCAVACKKSRQEIYNELIDRAIGENDRGTIETLVQAKKDAQGPVQWLKDHAPGAAAVFMIGITIGAILVPKPTTKA
jgi:hypothetical protein